MATDASSLDVTQSQDIDKTFGVKLRKATGRTSPSCLSRRSHSPLPSTPSPTNESKRYSTPIPKSSAPLLKSTSVASRQEAAEKAAIERRTKIKPALPPKPVLKVNSLGKAIKQSGARKSQSLPKLSDSAVRPPLVKAECVDFSKHDGNSESSTSDVKWTNAWSYDSFRRFAQKSALPSLKTFANAFGSTAYSNGKDLAGFVGSTLATVLSTHVQLLKVEEDRSHSIMHRRSQSESCGFVTSLGHKFIRVSLDKATTCDLCRGLLWGRCARCYQCVCSTISVNTNDKDHDVTPLEAEKDTQGLQDDATIARSIDEQSCNRLNSISSLDSVESLRISEDCDTHHHQQEQWSNADILTLLDFLQTTMEPRKENKEGDYANLWEAVTPNSQQQAFLANKEVMVNLMRSKSRHIPRDDDRRKAWVQEVETDQSDDDSSLSDRKPTTAFDMDKFERLKAKVNNLDLELTDFDHFADLKHSISLLELSEILQGDCKYSCHEDCDGLVIDSCRGATSLKSSMTAQSLIHADVDDTDSGYSGSGGTAGFTLTREEICSRIQQYNESNGHSSTVMTLPTDDNDAFQGFIQVCVSIERPISMSLSSRPTSIYEVLHRKDDCSSPPFSPEHTTSPVLLPKNTSVGLHINSRDTASEVVSSLLNKFKITDNPRKFALFEQTVEHEKEVKLRKIGDPEKPLVNFLRWSTENLEGKRFVLKENDCGEIMWEAFSIPELDNFLRMLKLEESEYRKNIEIKFMTRRKHIEGRMREIETERLCAKKP